MRKKDFATRLRPTAFLLAVTFSLAVCASTFAQLNPTEAPSVDSPDMGSPAVMQVLKPGVPDEGEEAGDDAVDLLQPAPEPLGSEVDVDQESTELADSEKKLWRIRPKGSVGMTYDDNIFISHNDPESDVIWGIEAGLAFELGDYRNLKENYLIAEYAGTGYFYTLHPEQNAFNQDAALLGQYRIEKLTLQLESRYQYLTGSDRNVGSFTNRNIFNNALRGIYEYSDKTSFDVEFGQDTALYQVYLNQFDYHLKSGFDYQLTGRIALGLEGVLGLLDVADGPLQYYQQTRLRARYQATGKLAVKFSGGVELREYEGDTQPVRLFPVYSLAVEYQPFDGTMFSLEGYCNSYGSTNFAGQNYLATGVSLSLQQRLFQKFFAGVAFGYENDTYYATGRDVEANRKDNYASVRPSLDYRFVEWMSAGVFYEFRTNSSNFTSYTFSDNRLGWQIALQF